MDPPDLSEKQYVGIILIGCPVTSSLKVNLKSTANIGFLVK